MVVAIAVYHVPGITKESACTLGGQQVLDDGKGDAKEVKYLVVKSEENISTRNVGIVLLTAIDSVMKQFPTVILQEAEIRLDESMETFSVDFLGDINGEEFNWGYEYPDSIVEI